MLRSHTILGFGLWLIAISLLGIPVSWKMRLYAITGIVLVAGYLYALVRDTIVKLARHYPQSADTFTENGGTRAQGGPMGEQ